MEDQILVFLLLPVLTFAQLIIARIIGQGGTAGRTLGAELLTAFGRLPSAIGTFLIVSLVSVLVSLVPLILVFAVGGGPVHGAAVLLVVTFWLNVRFGLAVPLLANDVLGLTSALGESWRLTRGHALRVAALFGAALVGSALLSWVLGMLGAAIGVIPANGTAASEPGWGVGRWMFELVGHAASSAMFAYWFAFQAVLMGALQREAGGAT